MIGQFKRVMALQYVVAAIYKFVLLADYRSLRESFLACMHEHDVRGTLLLAREGINGTVAGTRQAIDHLMSRLKSDPRLWPLCYKESYCDHMPFRRTMVKLKKEIVTMGVSDIDPSKSVGTYVKPGDWNPLISDPQVTVIDTRNQYEVAIGTFRDAVNPNTDTFRQFPEYVQRHLDPAQHKRVALFCTGGIRCEKATAYLKKKGFEAVYHLEGGILRYLKEVPESESRWQGECFVFDRRVAVVHGLAQGSHDLCYACRHPIRAVDKAKDTYVAGVSCPRCYDKTTPEQRKRFRDRQIQIQLAKARGEQHIGLSPLKENNQDLR